MPIILPQSNQAVVQNNLSATPSFSAPGVSLSPGGVNTKGTWTEVFASTNFDVYGISVMILGGSASAAQRNNLVDIGIGANPNEQPIALNLPLQGGASLVNTSGNSVYFLPLFIPKGTRVVARSQNVNGGQTCNLTLFLHGGFSIPPWQTYAGCEGIGVSTATSRSTDITAGSSGAESAWTDIGSATTKNYKAILPMVQTSTATTMNNLSYFLEWGYSSTTLGERFFVTGATESVGSLIPPFPDYINIPSGTQLQMRAECSGVAQVLGYALIGFY